MRSLATRDLAVGAVAAVAGLGLAAGLAGCSTKGTPYATPSSSASSSSASSAPAAGALPTGSMTPLPAATGSLTGSELKTVLLPASDFPAGYTSSSSDETDSGGALTSGPARYPLATVSCSDFVQHLGAAGFGETGMAADSVVGPDQAYDQAIYQFSSATEATAFVAGITPLAGRCPSFAESVNGTSTTMKMTATPGDSVAGQPSVELRQTASLSGTGLTLDSQFVASGVDVFVVSAVGFGKPAPTEPAKSAVIYNLMKRQGAAAELG